MLVSPSLLAADFLNLGRELDRVSNADFIHLDVMDGTFVPNISFGFPVIDAMAGKTVLPMDVHLMTVHPERWFERLSGDGVSMVSFHLEESRGKMPDNTSVIHSDISVIHSFGMKAGVAINPDIPVEELFQFIGEVDFFLIMSVFAGFGGQKFISESINRVHRLKEELIKRGDKALIEVDGGVNCQNACELAAAGTDIVVAGSSVFKADCPGKAISNLQSF